METLENFHNFPQRFGKTFFIEQFKLIFVLIVVSQTVTSNESWEDVHMICPQQCVCEYANFMDLSIAKWINAIELRKQKGHEFVEEEQQDAINDNEVYYEGDDSFRFNNEERLKFVMCMLTSHNNPKDLVDSLPNEVEALVLLYTGKNQNASISVSDFHHFYNLETLEIRGTKEAEFKLIFDDSIAHLVNLNLDTIKIQGSERPNFRPDVQNIDPSQNFDYVPNSERFEYNVSLQIVEEDIEILPYEIYKMEVEKMKTLSFYGWEKLKVLRINNCNLKQLYWEMFDGLEKLEHLSVERNSITTVPPFSFYGSLNIKSLSLAHNSIVDLNYRGLAGLLELELLDLSDNKITKLTEMTFPPFPKLEIFDIRDNPIKGIYQATFGVMNNTRVFYLGSDSVAIEKFDAIPFESLEKLTYLNILNLKVATLNQAIMKHLSGLEILKLKGSIKRIEYDTFSEMRNLKELYLSDCGIEEMSMDTFLEAKQLRILDLSRNFLRELPLGLFSDQAELEEIYLESNLLTTLPTEIFYLKSIKLIRLVGNPLNCSCDMINWKQAITNRVKTTKTDENCYSDENTERTSCTVSDYTYDNKFAPKCAAPNIVKNRNLSYALRKILKCSSKSRNSEKKKKIKEKQLKWIQKAKEEENRLKNSLEYQLNRIQLQANSIFEDDISNDIDNSL